MMSRILRTAYAAVKGTAIVYKRNAALNGRSRSRFSWSARRGNSAERSIERHRASGGRGSHDAEYGDRTYGTYNIVPRTGFERDNEAELVTSFGNWYQTTDQFNFGGTPSVSLITGVSTEIGATSVSSLRSDKLFTAPRTVMADSRPLYSMPAPPTNFG